MKNLILFLLCGPGSFILLARAGIIQVPSEEFIPALAMTAVLAVGIAVIDRIFGQGNNPAGF